MDFEAEFTLYYKKVVPTLQDAALNVRCGRMYTDRFEV